MGRDCRCGLLIEDRDVTDFICELCGGDGLFPPCPHCEIRAMAAEDPTIVVVWDDGPLTDEELAQIEVGRSRT